MTKLVNFKVSAETYEKMQKLRQEKSINISGLLRNTIENTVKTLYSGSNNGGGLAV